MRANGPDGRAWTVTRRPEAAGIAARLLPGGWIVEARTDDEVRCWAAASRRGAVSLSSEVALALRTGTEGPPGEIDPAPPRQDP